ncbi:hypothetical protein PVK06_014441 [Gossypium arboreum]|uniref:Uncharacterized protein n=1 Tax=Gossypium arboreum TaxID=29729 RepID=A0ABR0PUU3_GOSAR|nr:hypothetical protein PVK06_014441 [Gossypium arboreum]
MDGTPVLRVWTLKRSLTWKEACNRRTRLDFVRRCSKSRVPWHCGVVHDTRVFICQKDAYVADEAQSKRIPFSSCQPESQQDENQIMFETTFNAPVMNVNIKKDSMETLFSVVDLLCSQNPRNCRQNEKGSHGLSIKIKAVASTRKEYSFWIGGSILVSLSTRYYLLLMLAAWSPFT